MRERTLVVMVKRPVAGRVKTRLGRGIGMVGAAWWYRRQVGRVLRRVRDPRWRVVVAVDGGPGPHPLWPGFPTVGQGRGHLGRRMLRLLGLFGPGRVLVIGSDIPGIEPVFIEKAFRALDRADWVLGPAPDGGYWAIGTRGAASPWLFDRVRWSGPHALADTLAAIPGRVALADTLADVDDAADLAELSR